MYKIMAFNNGQPIILFMESEKVYMYTANGGRIYQKGIIFDDVRKDFDVFSCDNQYIYYISTDNKIKLAMLNQDRFTEFLSIPMEDSKNNVEIVNVSPLMCQNELYIFYCNHNKSTEKYEIYYILSTCPNKSCLIERNIDINTNFDVFSANEKIGLVLNDNYYYLSADKKMININNNLENSNKIHSLNRNIEDLKKALSKKSNELITVQKLLSEKNSEINDLKATQDHISVQYNELAEYAGKLQDELRKIRYMWIFLRKIIPTPSASIHPIGMESHIPITPIKDARI